QSADRVSLPPAVSAVAARLPHRGPDAHGRTGPRGAYGGVSFRVDGPAAGARPRGGPGGDGGIHRHRRRGGMKVFLSFDMEGVAGIVDWDQCVGPGADYAMGCRLTLGEVNA